jgi:hypothetical protein
MKEKRILSLSIRPQKFTYNTILVTALQLNCYIILINKKFHHIKSYRLSWVLKNSSFTFLCFHEHWKRSHGWLSICFFLFLEEKENCAPCFFSFSWKPNRKFLVDFYPIVFFSY